MTLYHQNSGRTISQRPKTGHKKFPQNSSGIKKPLPLPKGNSPYALAKRAEHAKHLEDAKAYLLQAIQHGDRAESAVKDYSSILHREHRTQEACDFLLKHRDLFTDAEKFSNLFENLKHQIEPTGNSLNMILQIGPISETCSIFDIKNLFTNSTRINRVHIADNLAVLYFPSHSAARKTLEGFLGWNIYTVHWVSLDGVVQGQAANGYTFLRKPKPEEHEAHESCEDTFEDSVEASWSKALEYYPGEEFDLPSLSRGPSENTAVGLLGRSLLETLD